MKPPSEPHAILAHYFVPDEAHKVQGALTIDDWQRGLDAYGSRLISASTWQVRALAGSLTDEVCVSFDDGLREAYVYAKPALDARGFTAAWNVYTQPHCGVPHSLERWRWVRNHAYGSLEAFYLAWANYVAQNRLTATTDIWPGYLEDRGYLTPIDRYFRFWRNEVATPVQYEQVMSALASLSGQTWQPAEHWIQPWELTQLQDAGHLIGLHTHTHPTVFGQLSLEQQHAEWATNRMILNHAVPRQITTASYPCGQMTDASVAWFKANGITLAWGATMKGSIPFECPRWSTGYWT